MFYKRYAEHNWNISHGSSISTYCMIGLYGKFTQFSICIVLRNVYISFIFGNLFYVMLHDLHILCPNILASQK
jgi:hypothetical protein